jgi:hypothetical protein
MSDAPPGKQSKNSRLLRPFKGVVVHPLIKVNLWPQSLPYLPLKRIVLHMRTRSSQGAQSITPHNAIASLSASPTTSAPQVNPQGTEYTEILGLSTSPSGPLTWEHRMKEWGSTAYEGLKTAIQGIYDCSGIFPPLQTTAGVLLTICKVADVRGSMCSTCKIR